ncbi:MAG: metalloregulator ArsR/SmtB family transcription factor [Candidatus Omnitrophica bacterium]|nr:metalloregulator ArsR/SmtB family transcription factor [Candidatus Omnitrophota bacterium]
MVIVMSRKYPYERASGMMKVIAHPVRLRLITLLEKGRMNVRQLQEAAGVKQSSTSQHLNTMARAGVLDRERQGNEVFYYIKKKEVFKILSCIRNCCGKER